MSGFAAAVTGLGLVTAAGIGVEQNWLMVVDGKATAASRLTVPGLPDAMACRVPDFSADAFGLASAWQCDRYTQLALMAAGQALADACIEPQAVEASRMAVVIGSGAGGTATLEEQCAVLLSDGPQQVSPMTLPMGLLNMAAGQVAIHIGATGPCHAPCSACASGAAAIGLARDLLRSGAADIVVAGGAEAPVTPLYLAAFRRMRTLSRAGDPETASRPFDSARDGFVLAEGAGIVVLESEEHASARGVTPVARVVGFGASADAHHVTAPEPAGRGAKLAMRAALRDAGLDPRDIGYVNAHGTSTLLNDTVEAGAIQEVFGDSAAVSSTKGVTGHALGAGGAIEAVYTTLAVRDGLIPPTANLVHPEPGLRVDLVQGSARARRLEFALTNSFGFGGQNAALLISA